MAQAKSTSAARARGAQDNPDRRPWRALPRVAAAAVSLVPGMAFAAGTGCADLTFRSNDYTVCRFDTRADDIRLVHRAPDGELVRNFDRLSAITTTAGSQLTFAMNGGMYHSDRAPVGLLVVDGKEIAPLNRGRWVGNFYLKPNGVFVIVGDGTAAVFETDAYRKSAIEPRYATQSGPMLVIDGRLHPRFLVDASSRNIRNGVGVLPGGQSVIFAISRSEVTFHEFGSLFREHLKTPNALYLDGSISRLFSAELGRNDPGDDMGPIIAVTRSAQSSNPSDGAKP